MRSNTLSSDIKRALTSRGFWIGIAGFVLVIVLSSLETVINLVRNNMPLENGYHAQFVMSALVSDWVTLTIPIVCALPFTTAFVDDIKSGFIKQYLHRAGVSGYIRGKLVACCLSGGLVLFIGIFIVYGLSALVLTPMELTLRAGRTAPPYLAQMIMTATILFFSGAFWSLFGFTFASLTMSRYMAYASPFILYYLLIILHERYFTSLYVLYPKEWLFPSEAWLLGGFGVLLLLFELIAIACLAFTISAKRRLVRV